MYALPCVKQAARGSLLTAQGAQLSALGWPRGKPAWGERGCGGIYAYIPLIHIGVQQKAKQQCKSIVL